MHGFFASFFSKILSACAEELPYERVNNHDFVQSQNKCDINSTISNGQSPKQYQKLRAQTI